MTDTTILLGRVGSYAYGLNHDGSDEDFMGIFVAPTLEVAGLHWNSHRESKVNQSPGGDSTDTSLHEIGKYLKLALKSNPTVTELLWLDDYLERDIWGNVLVEFRRTFLSQHYVHAAYRGYASQQLQKFIGSGEWKPKHARHCLRLIRQGVSAFRDGVVQVKVDDPQIYWDLAEMAPDKVVELLKHELDVFDELHDSPLPVEPDDSGAVTLLAEIRRAFLDK